ncbi:unnamed protein product [Diatraea saccharalis]|uniref:Uncharacterized protein n=1 Tax=Diatraea saccharalis TaxID=40085 RepID=A0A9N9R4V3_9NEOP|nr:unnamed protein product [Diatraea saccharalis]
MEQCNYCTFSKGFKKSKRTPKFKIKIKEGLKTVYYMVLLLNRRKPGELQRITLHDYLESENNGSDKNEEFDRALTATERILVKKFKRIDIRGKRSRGVPLLYRVLFLC